MKIAMSLVIGLCLAGSLIFGTVALATGNEAQQPTPTPSQESATRSNDTSCQNSPGNIDSRYPLDPSEVACDLQMPDTSLAALPCDSNVIMMSADGYAVYALGQPQSSFQGYTANVVSQSLGAISGVVRDGTGNPISGARVYASNYNWVQSSWGNGTYTAPDGSYTIPGVPTGTYKVKATHSGYASEYYDGYYTNYESTPVSVTAPNDTADIDFTLEPGGSISGVVRDGLGNPIQGATISALYCYTGYVFQQVGSSQTGQDGTYIINDLPPLDYRVQARASGYGYEFYDNSYSLKQAILIPVTAPFNTPNIDFILAPGGAISGIVRNGSGEPVPGALINVQDYETFGMGGSQFTGADGSFKVSDLSSGTFIVFCNAAGYAIEWYNNVYLYQMCGNYLTSIALAAPNEITNIDFILEPGGSISGNVTDESGNPIRDAWACTEYPPSGCSVCWLMATEYKNPGIPADTYKMRAQAPGYITEYYDNVTNPAAATLVEVIPPNDTGNINFKLGPAPAPVINTNTAAHVTANSATLKGYLDSLGAATSVQVSFQWGLTSGYGNETPPQTMDTTGPFSAVIDGLSPGANYHYRTKAEGNGTNYGVEMSLTTIGSPPALDTNAATGLATTSATLNGNLTSLGTAPSVQVSFQWGLTTGYGGETTPETMTGTGPFSGNISELLPGTDYHFRAKAVGYGTVYGNDTTLTTSGVPATPTPTPTPTPIPTSTPTPTPTESTPVSGTTREVNGDILPGVSITLDGIGPVVSDQSGQYEILASTTGNNTIVAHMDGFRDRTQIVNIAGLGPDYAVTCNFQGQHGLIPNAPDIWYALDCVNLWLYPPNPETGLDIWAALDVINAWLYPVQ